MEDRRLRILLVDDDEDDYLLVRNMLSGVLPSRHQLEWLSTYDAGLEAMKQGQYDVYLLDYRLDKRSGLELLQEAIGSDCRAPVIFLTGHGDYEIDLEAMKLGAADYLLKDQINAVLLERSIRYAIERRRTEEVLRESEKKLKLLSSRLLSAQEEERKRIAGDIHDSISSSLSALKFGLENALQQTEQGAVAPESLKSLVSLAQMTIEESRRIMTDLRPSALDDLGVVSTMGWFCREFQKTYSTIRIEQKAEVSENDVPESLKIAIFRVMQEAFHNIAKHSKAERATLCLAKNGGSIELCIKDHGTGFDVNACLSKGKGLGLTSMRERTELSGGSFKVESMIGAGTTIKAAWPVGK
jgi:signal transduction histidine kinase